MVLHPLLLLLLVLLWAVGWDWCRLAAAIAA
jgi:hypothetical protein